MADERIQIGDRVITLQMPGIFTVTGHAGRALVIESEDGVRLTAVEASLRRMPPAEAPAADEPDERSSAERSSADDS